jgi:hypothetical protein
MNIKDIYPKNQSPNYVYKGQLVDFLNQQGFTHGVTLQPNKPLSKDKLFSTLKHLDARVSRHLLGSRFYKKPRLHCIHFLEGQEKLNLHSHSLWRIPEHMTDRFELLFPSAVHNHGLWRQIIASGTHDQQCLQNPEKASWYVTKDHHHNSEFERMIISSEFHQTNKFGYL